MHMNPIRWRIAAALTVGALTLAACNESPISGPGARPKGGEADIALEVSSQMARPGDRIAIALGVDYDGGYAAALQGRVHFDASRLRYVGQVLDESFVLVNDAKASSGELRLVATNEHGFGARAA